MTGVAGTVARVFTVTLVAPLELVRTNLQAHGSQVAGKMVHYSGPVDVMRRVYATRGVVGMFNGLWPTLLRDVPFSSVYWTLYEYVRVTARQKAWLNDTGWSTFGVNFVAGAGAGMVASVVTTPFDVVKTHMQVRATVAKNAGESHGTVATIRSIVRSEGVGALMKGMGPRTAKVTPACAIMIRYYFLVMV